MQNDREPLPDQSEISSPDHQMNANLYPFQHSDNSENMSNFMQGIARLGPGGIPDGMYQHDQGLSTVTIMGVDGEPIDIPVDQLPVFLQEMAMNEPDMFQQLMADMDEERLAQFI